MDLGHNKLEILPADFGSIPTLLRLDLSNNRLEELPDSFGMLPMLIEINLTTNCLETLPDSFGHMNKLERAYIGGNELVTLPETIAGNQSGTIQGLTSLRILNLRSNQLTALPRTFGKLPDLPVYYDLSLSLDVQKGIFLGGNPITVPPPDVFTGGCAAIADFFDG